MTAKNDTAKATTAKASKAGEATSPQTTATVGRFTHQVAPGQRISIAGETREAGHKVRAADFITERDPDGKIGLQRLEEGGELVKAVASSDDDGDRAGGGLLEQGGGTGAGPSAAQIVAADAGDTGSQAVVDAALSGSEADYTKAADPDAPKA